MFGFLKKLFVGNAETKKEAGVQLEQVPYKVETPVLVDKVAAINDQPIKKPVQKSTNTKPAKKPATKKAAPKNDTDKKPATRGLKPKAK